jgi:hypothetical protein
MKRYVTETSHVDSVGWFAFCCRYRCNHSFISWIYICKVVCVVCAFLRGCFRSQLHTFLYNYKQQIYSYQHHNQTVYWYSLPREAMDETSVSISFVAMHARATSYDMVRGRSKFQMPSASTNVKNELLLGQH